MREIRLVILYSCITKGCFNKNVVKMHENPFSSIIRADRMACMPTVRRDIPYILESNPHPFYSFRGLKNQVRIRIGCGLDSRS